MTVGNIRLAPDSLASAKGVAALAGGGPSPYTRWVRGKNQLMKANWAGPGEWNRGTCYYDERATVYRTLKYPPSARDLNPTLLDQTRPTKKLDVPFVYKGPRKSWAALDDLYESVRWKELSPSLSVPPKGDRKEMNALGDLLGLEQGAHQFLL